MSGKIHIRLFEIHERRRSPDENQFGEDMRHVAVGRFVSLAERWRWFFVKGGSINYRRKVFYVSLFTF